MSGLDIKWLHAQFNLAWRSVCHYAAFLWPWRQHRGPKAFLDNYTQDGLRPTSIEYRAIRSKAGECIACYACDDVCPILRNSSPQQYDDESILMFRGPMEFVLAASRSSVQKHAYVQSLHILTSDPCHACKACEKSCPSKIPILELAKQIQGQ